jgi:hypothetical protein
VFRFGHRFPHQFAGRVEVARDDDFAVSGSTSGDIFWSSHDLASDFVSFSRRRWNFIAPR